MLPSVSDESALIIGTYFCAIENFTSGFEPNRALFWGNDAEFILMMENSFHQYKICICLVPFAKSHIFRNKLWKLSVKVCPVLCAKPIKIRPRPLPNSFQHHEFNSGLKISKQASVENHIFRDMNYCLGLLKISIFWYTVLCFGNRTYLYIRVDE